MYGTNKCWYFRVSRFTRNMPGNLKKIPWISNIRMNIFFIPNQKCFISNIVFKEKFEKLKNYIKQHNKNKFILHFEQKLKYYTRCIILTNGMLFGIYYYDHDINYDNNLIREIISSGRQILSKNIYPWFLIISTYYSKVFDWWLAFTWWYFI